MEKKLTVRKATQQDITDILALVRELAVYEKAPDEVSNTEEMMLADGFGSTKIFDAFVAEYEGKIIGTAITYYRYSTWKGKCLYLEDLIVSEPYRGIGAGKQLFNTCNDFGKKTEYKRMVWQVLDWNEPVLGLYKTYGAHLDRE